MGNEPEAGATATPIGMNEAARHLGMSRRTLTEVIKRHPHYSRGGRANLFCPEDLEKLRRAIREETLAKNKHLHVPLESSPTAVSLEEVLDMLSVKKVAKKKGRRR